MRRAGENIALALKRTLGIIRVTISTALDRGDSVFHLIGQLMDICE